MLIKLYNGLNRFAPGLRLNFRYFSWVPGHRSPTITMADLLPFFDLPPSFFLSLFLFLSFSLSSPPLLVSHPLLLYSISLAPLFFTRKSIDPAGHGHARPADTGAETRRQVSSHLRAHFVHVSRDFTFYQSSSHPSVVAFCYLFVRGNAKIVKSKQLLVQ